MSIAFYDMWFSNYGAMNNYCESCIV